jgi:hypothetical protein
MKLHICSAVTLCILLIITTSASGMEHNDDALCVQATTYNYPYQFMCLPLELQQQIVFPGGSITQITEDNADELTAQIRTFFRFMSVCKYAHENITFPWMTLELATKNRMMQEVNALMTKSSHKECFTAKRAFHLYLHEHPEKVSFGYNKYCAIALALVYSGAGADITDKTVSTTLLSKAVHAQDEPAVALVLNHQADPYQKSFDEDQLAATILGCNVTFSQIGHTDMQQLYCNPIFSRATTLPIFELFREKIDKQVALNMPESRWIITEFRYNQYPPEIMEAWIAYGFPVRCIWPDNSCMLHTFLGDYYQSPCSFKDTNSFLKKIELLLKVIPDMVNTKNDKGITPIDIAYTYQNSPCNVAKDVHEKIITLLRQHGAKSSKELEENF